MNAALLQFLESALVWPEEANSLRRISGGGYGFPRIPDFQDSLMVCARSFFEGGLAHNLQLSHAKRPAETSSVREGDLDSAINGRRDVSLARRGCIELRLPGRDPVGRHAAPVVRATV